MYQLDSYIFQLEIHFKVYFSTKSWKLQSAFRRSGKRFCWTLPVVLKGYLNYNMSFLFFHHFWSNCIILCIELQLYAIVNFCTETKYPSPSVKRQPQGGFNASHHETHFLCLLFWIESRYCSFPTFWNASTGRYFLNITCIFKWISWLVHTLFFFTTADRIV